MRVLIYLLIFLMGLTAGVLFTYSWHLKQIQKVKDEVPECVEPKEVFYL